MKRILIVAVCLLGATACVAEPLDGRRLTEHRERVRFAGYYPSSGTRIDVESYDFISASWQLVTSVWSGGTPITDAAGHDWYWFETLVQLPSERGDWGPSGSDGMRKARVRARVGNTMLAMFKVDADGLHNRDLSRCAGAQNGDGIAIYNNCRSGVVAEINAPCGDTGELCCSTGGACFGNNSCRNDHCVVPGTQLMVNLGVWPTNANRNWAGDGLQGVTTDGTWWFFSTTHHIYRVRKNGLDETGASLTLQGFPTTMPSQVNHWGDMDFHDGLLWVAFENEDADDRMPKGIAVFDANLNYVSHTVMEEGGNKAWVAINPVDGRLYTSDYFKSVKYVSAYDILWSSSGKLSLQFHHKLVLHSGTLNGVHNLQGGDFAANGNLYLASHDPGKLWVFDSAGYVRKSQALYLWPDDEVEGLVIWDTDAPGSGFDSTHANRGQVHVIRRDQEGWLRDDQFEMFHFRTLDSM